MGHDTVSIGTENLFSLTTEIKGHGVLNRILESSAQKGITQWGLVICLDHLILLRTENLGGYDLQDV